MKEFLSIPYMWKTNTDEEYVELVRRYLNVRRTVAYFSLAVGFLCIAIGIGIPLVIFNMIVMDHAQLAWKEAQPGLWFGWFIGSLGGFFLLMGVLQFGLSLNSFKGNRTERLLLKYFDENKKTANHALEGTGDPQTARQSPQR